MQLLYGLAVHGRRRKANLSFHANQWFVSMSFCSSLAYLSLYILRIIFYTVVFASYTMGSESAAPAASPVAAALALEASPSRMVSSSSNPKAHDLMEESVPMAIVQQFIEDNKEKGMPVNQHMADLKKKAEEIKIEKKRVAKELKNEERKRQRLRAKAKQLSAEDLVQVLALRASASASRKAKKDPVATPPPAPERPKEDEVDDE